jgi:hypothetical protein
MEFSTPVMPLIPDLSFPGFPPAIVLLPLHRFLARHRAAERIIDGIPAPSAVQARSKLCERRGIALASCQRPFQHKP